VPYVTEKLQAAQGPIVAVSDFMHSVQDQIREFVPGTYLTLGADGFGFSDTRPAARRHFAIDGPSVTARVLQQLAKEGTVAPDALQQAITKYQLLDVTAGTSGSAGGEA
jgi:pyruvate dehydrogenase E1 component